MHENTIRHVYYSAEEKDVIII